MGCKDKLIKKLGMAVSDKEELNRQILRLHKCMKEVEKNLNRSKK